MTRIKWGVLPGNRDAVPIHVICIEHTKKVETVFANEPATAFAVRWLLVRPWKNRSFGFDRKWEGTGNQTVLICVKIFS